RIVGGQYDDANNYKHLVRVVADGSMCGGALISKNAVLTAAHCAMNPNPGAYKINEGKTQQFDMDGPNSERLIATAVYANQEFNKFTFLSDVACWIVSSSRRLGKPDPFGPVSQSLKSVDLRVVDDGRCSQYGKFNPASHICVSSDIAGTSACNGDSGISFGDSECAGRVARNKIMKVLLIHNLLSIRLNNPLVARNKIMKVLLIHNLLSIRLNNPLVARNKIMKVLLIHNLLSIRLNNPLVARNKIMKVLLIHNLLSIRLNNPLVARNKIMKVLLIHNLLSIRLNNPLVARNKIMKVLLIHNFLSTRASKTHTSNTRATQTSLSKFLRTRLSNFLATLGTNLFDPGR
ncbi:hypothetical protein L0F63_004122, partial [Massospora cicadina]